MTPSVNSAVVLPPAFDAVIVYACVVRATVGVPEMAPVPESNAMPVGRLGEIENDVAGSPLAEGCPTPHDEPRVQVSVAGVYVSCDGGSATTRNVTIPDALPCRLVPVTVKVVDESNVTPVPEIEPSAVLNVKPGGKFGVIEKLVGAPPAKLGRAMVHGRLRRQSTDDGE